MRLGSMVKIFEYIGMKFHKSKGYLTVLAVNRNNQVFTNAFYVLKRNNPNQHSQCRKPHN